MPAVSQPFQKSGQGDVRFGDGQTEVVGVFACRAHGGQFAQPCRLRRRRPSFFVQCELDDVLAAQFGDEFARRAQGDDLAVIDHGHAIAQPFGLVHVMRGQKDGAALRTKTVDQVPQLPARLRVEARRRLVEHEQVRIANEGAGHGEALLLAAGQFTYPRGRFFVQRHPADDLVRLQAAPVKAAKQGDDLDDLQLFGQACFLERDADALADGGVVAPPVHVEHLDRAGGRLGEALDDLDGGGFAGPVGTEQAEAFAGFDRQVQSANRLDGRPAFVGFD